MPPPLRFIFNPRAGRPGRVDAALAQAREFIRRHQPEARIVPTERPHHATELARQAVRDGCPVVVAIGGDGTINEIAAALAHTPVTLGLIPCGSGNGLGRHLGLPGPGRLAWDTLRHGRVLTMDAGLINGRLFFTTAGFGLEAATADRFARRPGRGAIGYLRAGWRAWREHRPETCVIHANGRTITRRVLTLTVANAGQYGNGARIAPSARVDDGLLDLVALPPAGACRAAPLCFRLFTGGVLSAPGVLHLRQASFDIERPEPGLIQVDGETLSESARLAIAVQPRCLRVLVPAGRGG